MSRQKWQCKSCGTGRPLPIGWGFCPICGEAQPTTKEVNMDGNDKVEVKEKSILEQELERLTHNHYIIIQEIGVIEKIISQQRELLLIAQHKRHQINDSILYYKKAMVPSNREANK